MVSRLWPGCLAALGCLTGAGALTEQEILDGAPERIRRYRMSDLELRVVDADGRPVSAAVHVEQLRHRFLFGCNIFGWRPGDDTADQAYQDRFAALLNFATLPFYWAGYERRRGEPGYDGTAQVAAWCAEHRITTKGHPLVWNHEAGAPRWLPDDPNEVHRLSVERVRAIVSRFRDPIGIWDVLNEPTDPWRFENPVSDWWRQAGVIETIKESFALCRAANPDATLLINDYKLDQFDTVVEQLVDDQGRPIYDVIGLQSHMHGGVWPVQRIWESCEKYARFGVPLHFTETTITSGAKVDGKWTGTTPEGEARQREGVERFYTILFSHPAVQALTWWDFSDRGAWMGAPSGLLRPDMSPKPAYERLLELIRGEWWTDETVDVTGGRATVRVFQGDYRLSATIAGRPVARDVTVTPGETTEVTLTAP